MLSLRILVPLAVASAAFAEVPAWGTCGGKDYTGETTCVAGYTCVYSNDWYSQCLPGAASSTTSAASSSSSSAPLPTGTSTAKLNTLAKAIGWKYFGSATDNGELADATYTPILKDSATFGSITPGNSQKWDATEKTRGVFTFEAGDVIVDFARANGQLVRGHTAVWHSQLASWVTNGGFDNSTLLGIVANHTTALVSHFKGKIYAWDVVNEPFNEDGTFRSTDSVFYRTTGVSYIATALRAARAADPSAKLYLNDYNLEYGGAKATAMANLAKSLLAQGVPLDGIGLQGHLIVGSTPGKSSLVSVLQQYTSLGLDVAYTELDIRMTLPATEAKIAQQKTDYQNVVASCKAVPKCVGITVWDYTDKYSWIPSVFAGQGYALPWDDKYVRKPAYDGIVLGLTT